MDLPKKQYFIVGWMGFGSSPCVVSICLSWPQMHKCTMSKGVQGWKVSSTCSARYSAHWSGWTVELCWGVLKSNQGIHLLGQVRMYFIKPVLPESGNQITLFRSVLMINLSKGTATQHDRWSTMILEKIYDLWYEGRVRVNDNFIISKRLAA